jgi:hypothetical protein
MAYTPVIIAHITALGSLIATGLGLGPPLGKHHMRVAKTAKTIAATMLP